jgi:trans-2,3-dihydro-3-hydroxyanthranilate isomerase
MLSLDYVLCDVFTDRSLTGNQLAVFTDARGLSAATMQELARELNLAESVFVLPPSQAGHARIRIFTPTRELPFAGHPTLGTAFVLGRALPTDCVNLETGAGIVPVMLEREAERVMFGWMSQPVPKVGTFARQSELFAALGVGGSMLPVETYDLGPTHVYVNLRSKDEVAGLRPDLRALQGLCSQGVNVFAGGGMSWKTRMFAPSHGVAEDAATGSAAGPLAMHLLRHGCIRSREMITIEQGAEIGRPSILYARAHGTPEEIERVEVGGRAVIVGRGELTLGDRHAEG